MKKSWQALSIVVLLGAAVAVTAVVPPPVTAATSRFRDIGELVGLGGAWRSRGYGWIWAVEDGSLHVYDESGSLCLENPNATYDVEDLNIRFAANDDASQLSVTLGDPAYRYTFDRIPAVPEACHRAPQSDPVSVFNAAVETIATHYPFFEVRQIDWPPLVETLRARVTPGMSERELFDVLSELLSHFHDAHIALEATIDDEDLSYAPDDEDLPTGSVASGAAGQAEPAVTVLPGFWNYRVAGRLLGDTERTAAEGQITYGLIDGDIGYLAIGSMADYAPATLDRALDRAIDLFTGAKAVIVDVSMNDGGHDTIARHIASRFAATPTVGYFKHAGDSATEGPQAVYLLPSGRPRYTGPVYLVTSRETLSAGEVFVLAMRSLPNVTQIGEPTNGSFSDQLSKPLPNGWLLQLSNEIYLDSAGAAWEGLGIPPTIEVRVRPRKHATNLDIDSARSVIDFIRRL